MRRNEPWTDEQIALLKELLERKISLSRASVILKHPVASVQMQARRLGTPFPGVRAIKAAFKAKAEAPESRDADRR